MVGGCWLCAGCWVLVVSFFLEFEFVCCLLSADGVLFIV